MRHFKFEEFENFPLDQTIMKELQGNSLAGLEHLLRGLDIDQPVAIGGFEVTDLGVGNVSIGPGLFWHPTYGFTTFEGVASIYDIDMNKFSFELVDEDLSFEDTVEPAISYARAFIEPFTGSEDHWTKTIARRWWHFLGKSAQAPLASWVPLPGVPAGTGNFGEYYHNKAAGIVFVRGAVKHFNITSGDPYEDEPMQMNIGGLPEGLRPSRMVYFRSSIETHVILERRDYQGTVYYGDVGRCAPIGMISLSQRRLQEGSSADFLHYYSFSFQL